MNQIRITAAVFGFFCSSAFAFEPLQIEVPSDPKAQYTVLDIQAKGVNEVSVTAKRNGPSGESFARRLVNCAENTFRYTGDADSLEGLNGQILSGAMGPLVDGSISDVISKFACGRV